MRVFRSPVLGATLLAVALVAAACGSGEDEEGTPTTGAAEKGTVTVGAVAFAENQILGEIYAQVLENAGYRVERQLDLDSREILQPAIESGEVDVAPEYLATLITFLGGEASSDPAALVDPLNELLDPVGQTVLDFSNAVDTNAFVVTQETADEFGLASVSDLAPVAADLTLGGPPECPERPFCIPGLQDVYGVEFGDFIPLDVGGPLTVEALDGGEIDVALLFSTDGVIADRGWVLLEDDKALQQADNIAPVVRQDALDGELETLLNAVSAALTTENMTELNGRVTIGGEDPADVAADFLQENGLL